MKTKKLLASLHSRSEKGKVRQLQLIGYLSLSLNIILLLILAVILWI